MDYKRSRIQMTLDLLALDDWTSAEIDMRQQWMAIVADRIWSEQGASRQPLQFPSLDEARQIPSPWNRG